MTDHPSLQPYVDAWTESIEAITELVKPLVEGEWNRRTACPGWSVRDVVSHIIGAECELLGDPRPIHTLPRDLYHVVDEPSRHMEVQVDVRRHHTGPEMTGELEYTVIRRSRQLRNERRGPDAEVRDIMPGRGGSKVSLELQLRMRAFDVWVHEQDLRRALG
ncbi:MAG: maleylpyruvate isomerase family mycothiol-dependent enzyme, partial [Streptomyces sp.]